MRTYNIVVYSMINNINWWLVNSNLAASRRRSDVHVEDESEKTATTSTRTHSAADTTTNQELWTRILTSVGLLSYEPTVPCIFSRRWQLSLTAIELVALARTLAPCHIQAIAVYTEEGLSLYIFSTWTATRYNIVYQLVKSSVFKPIITY